MPDGGDNQGKLGTRPDRGGGEVQAEQRPIEVGVLGSIGNVGAEQWDSCAGAANPTVSHAFLTALEDSGAADLHSGWAPQHLVIFESGTAEARGRRLLACAPLYAKSHSYGEYVFDWSWADAYERAGGRYYPKLQSAVPFTPVPGPRLLLRRDLRPEDPEPSVLASALIQAMVKLGERIGASSLHVTFPEREDWGRLGEAGLLRRLGLQYHWENPGYRDFEDFLAALSSRKRKAIRKERREVAKSGISLRILRGDEIRREHWHAFYGFYLSTIDRKWASAYLNREFFLCLGETMADKVVLVMAEDEGRPVAGALNLLGQDALYGRNWGCSESHRFLHFEACYYQAIEVAIREGLKRVEAGAQGEHKIQRGYLPVETYSAHWIADAGFRTAVEDFLERERRAVRRQIAALSEFSPFRQDARPE